MWQLIETSPSVMVQESEYQRLLGYPRHRPVEGRAAELMEESRKWFARNGRPWIYAVESGALELRDQKASIDGRQFSSRRLHEVFAESRAHAAVLVAVSAGKECEEQAHRHWQEGRPDEYYFLKVYGSAVVEHLVTQASGRICARADENGLAVLPHLSPGYSGWDIGDQPGLWNLFRQPSHSGFPGGLEVMESGMLRPENSLLAVFGLTRDLETARRFSRLVPCENCSLSNCRYRRATHKPSRKNTPGNDPRG